MPKVITKQKAREVDMWCRARSGLPYLYGGAFSTDPKRSCDCSALVLQTGAYIMGRTDWSGNRYGSTESFRLDYKIVYDIGFKRLPAGGVAALGFKPIMLVGLQHGGGGVNSHTACTLFYADVPGGEIKQSARGIDWESSGSNGVRYYDYARAWNDSLFHDFWYLDATLETATVPATPQPVIVGPADDQLNMRFNCLGGQTLVEALAEVRDRVCGTEDRAKPGVVTK
ncbi:hypothetical protein [Mycobacterium sp. 48b]|uniref:hypothetical protein n=1 Tax=Mycobacterium sp. 48b TaxID=3400426 RepID=UPI003AAD142A